MYDAAGEFGCRVGRPAKRGVGGGVIAIVPGKRSICVRSLALDACGSSVAAPYAPEPCADEMADRRA